MREIPTEDLFRRHEELWKHRQPFRCQARSGLALRTYRALTWLHYARAELHDRFTSFVFYWIAFNALYADSAEGDPSAANARQAQRAYFDRLLRDQPRASAAIRAALEGLATPIGVLMNDPVVRAGGGRSTFDVRGALAAQSAAHVLHTVFGQLYAIRNWLFHGGVARESHLVRDCVAAGTDTMTRLLPAFVELMLEEQRLDEHWGDLPRSPDVYGPRTPHVERPDMRENPRPLGHGQRAEVLHPLLEAAGLWDDSAGRRLKAARSLAPASVLGRVQADLSSGCPVAPWPYGNATSVNPLLVTLGPSPGAAPDPTRPDPAELPFHLPTAGERHPHTTYEDPRRFWDKIRWLAQALLHTAGVAEDDAYALFGNMNLDTRRSGSASNVRIDPAFAAWVLRTVRDKLRPRFLVCFGLRRRADAAGLLAAAFGFHATAPHAEHALACYRRRRLTFQEWDCTGPSGNHIKIVHWPQHPSRPPFTSIDVWQAACREFVDRHGHLLRP